MPTTLSCHNRKATDHFNSFTDEELARRDEVNLDTFWLKDEAMEETANLTVPHLIAGEITADLETARETFSAIEEDLKGRHVADDRPTGRATHANHRGRGPNDPDHAQKRKEVSPAP